MVIRKRVQAFKFNIPVKKIKDGYYSDKYFVHARNILIKDKKHPNVLMQVWCRDDGILCGIDEAISILKLCSKNPKNLKIKALYDGNKIKKGETVMTIEGDYSTFAHLETVFLGVLARGTSVATAVKKMIDTAKNKMILFFPARFDHYLTQESDGYASYIAGATGVSTDAQAIRWGGSSLGTIPHALIAAYNGDTVAAAVAFDKYISKDIKRIVLVDFDNDCIGTTLKVAKVLGKKLWGVRFDTAENLRDKSVIGKGKDSFGVCPELCFKARRIFDKNGYKFIKIVVSGGFDEEKVKKFMKLRVPFDAIGIGSSLFRKKIDFTADIVQVEGKHCAKVGRKYMPNSRLSKV